MTPEEIEKIIADHEGEQGALISILEDIQDRYHYLPEDALRTVARKTDRSLVDIYGVATFYKAFSLQPRGKHLVSVCLGTACHVRSAPDIVDEFKVQLGLKPGETSGDREFTLETVNCLGTCALGPIVAVDGRYFSNVKRSDVKTIIRKARTNFEEDDASRAEGAFPGEVVCPHCNHSLMDALPCAGNHSSIALNVSFDGQRGRASISGLLGRMMCRSEHDIPPDTRVSYSCPSCLKKLAGSPVCIECGSPMVSLPLLGGGLLLICSRWGCMNSTVQLDGLRSHAKSSNSTNRIFPG